MKTTAEPEIKKSPFSQPFTIRATKGDVTGYVYVRYEQLPRGAYRALNKYVKLDPPESAKSAYPFFYVLADVDPTPEAVIAFLESKAREREAEKRAEEAKQLAIAKEKEAVRAECREIDVASLDAALIEAHADPILSKLKLSESIDYGYETIKAEEDKDGQLYLAILVRKYDYRFDGYSGFYAGKWHYIITCKDGYKSCRLQRHQTLDDPLKYTLSQKGKRKAKKII